MALDLLFRVFLMVAISVACVSAEYTHTSIPVAVITPHQSQFCPSMEESETALQVVHNRVMEVVDRLRTVPQCGEGVWYRVAYLDMRDPSQECPSNWIEISTPVRTCGRPVSAGASCPAEHFSSAGSRYNRVCGRVIGYQDGSTDAFVAVLNTRLNSIDTSYTDGLVVTHGMPRTHIWTFAAGATEASIMDYTTNCPCANPAATNRVFPPSFVNDNYFCESGNPGEGLGARTQFFANDSLWDGRQCEGECCSNGKSPPWFSVNLTNPTTDDIEVRICGNEGTDNEDTPIQLLEIYIQMQ